MSYRVLEQTIQRSLRSGAFVAEIAFAATSCYEVPPLFVIDEKPSIKAWEYDAHGNLIKETYDKGADGKLEEISVWTYVYNGEGKKIKEIADYSADGVLDLIVEYDAEGREIKQSVDVNSDAIIDQIVTWEYDAEGREIQKTFSSNGQISKPNEIEIRVYAQGRITRFTYEQGADWKLKEVDTLEYDANGRDMKREFFYFDFDGKLDKIQTWMYDANKTTRTLDEGADGKLDEVETWEYDAQGTKIKHTADVDGDGKEELIWYDGKLKEFSIVRDSESPLIVGMK